MARFVYDEDKVNESLETLKNATKQVSETAQGFSSALSEIANASKGYLWIDTATLPEMPVQVTKTIEEIMQLITAKQTAIEEYNASPWYEKIFGSAGMILTKLGEGIGTAGEQLLDGAATIVGFGVGLFSKDMQSSISQFIEKDHVGDFFYDQYETGALKWINDKSYFSHTSTAANVFKGVGVATGYILTAAATGGVAGAVGGSGIAAGAASGVSSIGVNTVVAGIGGVGSGTQSGLQNNLSFNEAALQGLKQGAIQAGTVFVTGKAIDKISSSGVVTKATDKIASKALGKETVESLAMDGASPTKYAAEVLKTKVGNATSKITSPIKAAGSKLDDAIGTKVLGKETVESLATEGVTPAGYAKEVLKTKVGNATSKITSPIKAAGSKLDDAIGTKVLGKETVESLATEGVTPAGYAKEVLKTKVGNATSKITSPIKAAGSKLDDAIGTKVLGKETMDALKIDGGNFTKYVGNKISSGIGGATTSGAAAATGNLLASGANQSIAQNANAQFKVEMDPSNHVELNTDTPDTVVELIETPDTTPSPAPTDNKAPSGSEPVADTVAPTNNSTGNQATTYENASSGTYSNAGTIKTTGSNTSSSIQFRTETPVQSTTTPNNSVSTPEINTPTQTVPDTGNNPTMPDSNTGNGGSNTGSNTDTTVPGGSTTTPTVPETPSTNPGDGISGGITTPEEPVPGTPNPNPPTDNVGGNITDIADNITGGTGGSTTGNYNNYGSSYGNSIIGGLNNNGSQLGPEGELSYENKPDSGILDGNDSINTIDKGNSLDVISIDKDTPKNPSTSSGGSSVIPTILGVGAAGAAGVAGIHYVQKKFGKDNEYYEEESSEENNDNNDEYNVSSNDSINISDEPSGMIEEIPKYKAGGVNQLKLDDGADVKINDNNDIIAPQTQEELE